MPEPTPVPIRAEYTPTFRDYLWLNITVAWRRLKWAAFLVALAPLTLLCALIRARGGPAAEEAADPAGYAFGLVYVLLLPVTIFVLIPACFLWSARRQWHIAEALREPRVYEFSDFGIAVESSSASGRVAWDNVARADLTGGLIILTYTQPIYLFLPISAFPGPDVLDAFQDLLRAKVPVCRGF